jgi:hypothetical protein
VGGSGSIRAISAPVGVLNSVTRGARAFARICSSSPIRSTIAMVSSRMSTGVPPRFSPDPISTIVTS